MPTPPVSPGDVSPGDLYVDRATQTIWLGVSLSDDPAGVVILSDYPGFSAAITAALASANSYTDGQIATRAPTVHTHVAAQITDFAAAVAANIPMSATVPSGAILMYSGPLTDIGVGAWAGWNLCDGSNGTPDLRDRFVIGAGNKAVQATSAGGASTNADGAHSHVVNGTSLSIAQLPVHSHSATLAGITAAGGAHTHDITTRQQNFPPPVNQGGVMIGDLTLPAITNLAPNYAQSDGAHTHSVTVSGATDTVGSGATHAHTITAGGAHSHAITAAAMREGVPYMALAYVMKL